MIRNVNLDKPTIDIEEELAPFEIVPRSKLLLDWRQFKDVVEIQLTDLSELFRFMWFPAADDLSIFDESCSWMLFIQHDGELNLTLLR